MIAELVATINVAAYVLLVLLAGAALTYVVRDWDRLVALGAAALTGASAVLLWRIDAADLSGAVAQVAARIAAESGAAAQNTIDEAALLTGIGPAISRFGFSLQMSSGALPALLLAFVMATVALLLAARFPQGRSFVPMTLALLAGYMLWFMMLRAPIDVVLVQPLGLILLAALSAIALQAGRPVRAAGPVRWIVAPVLAFPVFFIANYYIQLAPLNPQDFAPLRTASVLLTFGLLLLMAPVPLHSVGPATAETAPPLATALFTLLYQLALISLLARMVGQYAFMQTIAPLNIWFAWAGLVTAIWAGIAAIGSDQPGRLWGYVALHDWGLILLLLSVPGLRTWSLVIFLFLLRVISMLTSAAGLAALEANVRSLEPEKLHGAGVRLPWNSAAYLVGALGLVGFPLSAGFAGHWAALQLVAASDWRPAASVLIASGTAILALVRMARMLYGTLADPLLPRERPVGIATAVVMLILSMILALAPQLLNGPVSRALLSLGT